MGLEPKTYGLKVRNSESATTDAAMTSDDSKICLASCLAFLDRESPELAAVARAWDTLPEPIRAGVLAMIRAASGKG
ncbi:MAG: hypothetical protein K8T25_09590 [Planctomycetia bacterium]|nr:hypothetical protein [Planctomycetia bacterium]